MLQKHHLNTNLLQAKASGASTGALATATATATAIASAVSDCVSTISIPFKFV